MQAPPLPLAPTLPSAMRTRKRRAPTAHHAHPRTRVHANERTSALAQVHSAQVHSAQVHSAQVHSAQVHTPLRPATVTASIAYHPAESVDPTTGQTYFYNKATGATGWTKEEVLGDHEHNPMLKSRTASNDNSDSGYIEPFSEGEVDEVLSDAAVEDEGASTMSRRSEYKSDSPPRPPAPPLQKNRRTAPK